MRLAAPVVAVQLGMMAMGVVDTIMVGHLSGEALGAVALGHVYVFLPSGFAMGLLMALDPLVAQAMGARDRNAAARGIQRGLLLALLLALPASALHLPAEAFFRLAGQPAALVEEAGRYVRLNIPGILPFLVFVVLRQSLQAMGRLGAVLAAMLVANAGNVLLNWCLIFGNLGFPAMGVAGAAWATVGGRWTMALVLLALCARDLGPYLRPWRRETRQVGPLLRMAALGLPIGLQITLEMGAFGAAMLLMGRFGAVEVAAHQVAVNLAAIAFMVPLGISAAAAVRVGRAVGAEDPAALRGAAWSALGFAATVMLVFAATFLCLPGLLASAWTVDREVAALAARLLPVAGIFQVADGLQVVAIGVLRGMGETRSPLRANVVGFWFLGIPLGWVLAFPLGVGPTGLWWGLAAGLAAVAAALLMEIRSRLARKVERVDVEGG